MYYYEKYTFIGGYYMRDLSLVFYFMGTILLSGGIGFIISQKLTERKMGKIVQEALDEISQEIDNLLSGK